MGQGGSRRVTIAGLTVLLRTAILMSVTPAHAQDPSASPGPTAGAGVTTLGATTVLLSDDFEPIADWGLLATEEVRIEGEDGGLRIRLRSSDQANWTWRGVGQPSNVLRTSVTAAIDAGSGEAGPMCGSTADDPSFYLGVVTTQQEWVLAHIVDGTISVIARDTLAAPAIGDDTTVRLELECAVTGDGRDRLAFFVDGVNVADATDAGSLGPFDRVGLYAGVFQEEFGVVFDDLVAFGGETYDPQAVSGQGPDASAEPSPEPSGPQLTSLGATSVLWEEAFSDRTWAPSESDGGTIDHVGDQLRFVLRPTNNAIWTWLRFPAAATVLGIETDVTLDEGDGSAGPMCGSAEGGDPTFYFAGLETSNDIVIGRIEASQLTDLLRTSLPDGTDVTEDPQIRVRIECAGLPAGGDRIAVWVDGQLAADHVTESAIGPFDKAGLLGEGGDRRWQATFADLVVRSGATYAPQGGEPVVSPAPLPSVTPPTPPPVGALLDALPDAYASDCRTAPGDASAGQLEAVLCVPAGSATTAEYYRYASAEALQTAFDQFLTLAGGDRERTDCQTGPAVVDYMIDGRTAGALACYDDPRGGVTFQWMNRDLLVLAFGTHASGAYADAYTWWQDAGPKP